ncbi:MAG: hypothetical protein CM15mP19_02070 [Gammaproteobacteria bacterium]|nr:MAG: hypothetical protein CM15mP19_02070 [Gammaproteobacteria bacterium]
MDSLGNSIAQSQKKYDDARNKLLDGKGSVSSRIQGLVSLGSKEAKKLSDDWIFIFVDCRVLQALWWSVGVGGD